MAHRSPRVEVWDLSKLFLSELLISLAVGALPCFLIYHFGGTGRLTSFFETVAPDTVLTWYLVGLFFLALMLGLFAKWAYSPHDAVTGLIRWLSYVSYEAGATLVGTLRLIAGAIAGLLLLSTISGEPPPVREATIAAIMAMAALFESSFLTFFFSRSKQASRLSRSRY